MKRTDVKVGGVYLCYIGTFLAHVVVTGTVEGYVLAGRKIPDRFTVRRLTEGKNLPKPRTAAALRICTDAKCAVDHWDHDTTTTVDGNPPHELILYLENTENLAHGRDTIYRALAKKKDNGTYDKNLAPRDFAYFLRLAAESYAREIDRGRRPYYVLFSMATIRETAREMVEKFEQWYKYDRTPEDNVCLHSDL